MLEMMGRGKGIRGNDAQPAPGWEEYNRAEQVKATCCMGGEDEGTCGFIHKLKWDLVNSYYWTGDCVRDYLFFVKQWHPLLGIIMCHPNHPWSKSQRFYMFMISAGLTFIPSCAIVISLHKVDDYLVGTTTEAPGSGGETLGESESLDVASAAGDAVRWLRTGSTCVALLLTLVFVTLPDAVLGGVLYQLAISETRCSSCPFCIPLGRCLMKYTLIFAAVICCVTSGIGLLVLQGSPPVRALLVMLYGKAWSYATWFAIWTLLPCQLGFLSRWTHEKREADRLRYDGRAISLA